MPQIHCVPLTLCAANWCFYCWPWVHLIFLHIECSCCCLVLRNMFLMHPNKSSRSWRFVSSRRLWTSYVCSIYFLYSAEENMLYQRFFKVIQIFRNKFMNTSDPILNWRWPTILEKLFERNFGIHMRWNIINCNFDTDIIILTESLLTLL